VKVRALLHAGRVGHALAFTLAVTAAVAGCGGGHRAALPDQHFPLPVLTRHGTEIGRSSWYGPKFHGHPTANGEIYDQHAMTCAHRSLPLGTWIEVRDVATGRRARVRVNDRGPYVQGRVLDLSYAAAKALGMVERGVIDVEILVISPQYDEWPIVRYAVQLGAFRDRLEAQQLSERARDEGARPIITVRGASPPLYHVRLGPYADRPVAAAVVRKLRRNGFHAVIIEEAPQPRRSSDTARALQRHDARAQTSAQASTAHAK
jgi:rare lipoprotein A